MSQHLFSPHPSWLRDLQVIHADTERGLPARIAPLVAVSPSTVHLVLTRCRLQRLAWLDWATGTPVRYEYPGPGALVHVEVKKLGHIRWRQMEDVRTDGNRNHKADKSGARRSKHGPLRGHAYMHAAVDDHSSLACEVHEDETRETAAAFWVRANLWFAQHGITLQRVLTDIQSGWATNPVLRVDGRGGSEVVRHLPVNVA